MIPWPAPDPRHNQAMGDDPNFRLKAFAVIACVLGVFLCSYVAQRVFYWMRTRKREDVDTTRVAPFIDMGLVAVGALVIWLSIEALWLAIVTSRLNVQPTEMQKIAEVEVGKLDREFDQTNLWFYRVDSAGRRLADQRRPVLTSGGYFAMQVETVAWRGMWRWLGQRGFYQFVALGGVDSPQTPATNLTPLEGARMPGGMGALVFLQPVQAAAARERCTEGMVYDILLDPEGDRLTIVPHE
jgi:hypothetical protein